MIENKIDLYLPLIAITAKNIGHSHSFLSNFLNEKIFIELF
jgi:hypothetical protein